MVRIQSSDGGTVQVGGDFGRALGFVKSLPGARFDGQRKVWTVQATAAEVAQACGVRNIPCDLPDGTHRTAYGNGYSRREWDAQAEMRRAETRVSQEMAPDFAAVETWLDEQLATYAGPGAPTDHVRRIHQWIINAELDEAIENSDLRFRSDARRDALLAIAKDYDERWLAVANEEMNRKQAAVEKIEQEAEEGR